MLASRKGSDGERIQYVFRRVLTRDPDADETKLATRFLSTQRQRFRSGQLNAVRIGGAKKNADEIAAWTTLARGLFSLDETVTRN